MWSHYMVFIENIVYYFWASWWLFSSNIHVEEFSIETACGKIDLAIRMMQCLYADMLAKHEFKRNTFAFFKYHSFYNGLTIQKVRKWNQNEMWKLHAMKILVQKSQNGQH